MFPTIISLKLKTAASHLAFVQTAKNDGFGQFADSSFKKGEVGPTNNT
jgi:hypothetical protein